LTFYFSSLLKLIQWYLSKWLNFKMHQDAKKHLHLSKTPWPTQFYKKIYCYTFLGSHTKNEKIQKKNISKKRFGRNPKNNRSEKRILECRKKVKIGWGGSKMQKVEIWQYMFFYWWEPCWQRKFKLRKKSLKLDVYGLN